MVAPCSGALAVALLHVPPIRLNLLGYTGSKGCIRALHSLAKAMLMRKPGDRRPDDDDDDDDDELDDDELERNLIGELFFEYKKLRDPIRRRAQEGELTVDDEEDPSEVIQLAEVLSLQATAGLTVHPPLLSPRLVLAAVTDGAAAW